VLIEQRVERLEGVTQPPRQRRREPSVPDPDLPFKLAMPFAFPMPAETPAEDQGRRTLPATGPYMVMEATPNSIELVRNREFEEWAVAAQPDGFVDAISWRFKEGISASFDELEGGELDVMIEPPSPQDLATLRSAHPEQVVGDGPARSRCS
jgi:peptide/nickel transport system substrate-binding protein